MENETIKTELLPEPDAMPEQQNSDTMSVDTAAEELDVAAAEHPEPEEIAADEPEEAADEPVRKKYPLLMVAAMYVLAFCIPTAIGLLMYKVKEITPFGDNSVLCMDLWGQYAPMYAQLSKSESLAELFYSWNGAFGYNNWAQSAYYCNSIFLLPLRLVPLASLARYIDWMCLLKLGFAGVTCLAFLRYKTKSESLFLLAGSSAYALCAYMLAFLSQPMWTDSLIYVPLLLIGMEQMLREKKPLMYILMLALTICSSFYIGFAVCIFCCLYFASLTIPTLSLKRNAEGKLRLQGMKNFGAMTGRFSASSILGGLIAAPVILPILHAISLTIASEAEAPKKLEWYGSFSYIIRNMLSEQPLCVEYTGANLSVGMIAFLLLPLYFLNKRVPVLQRVMNGIILAFLGMSINCNLLNFFWHGFHFPNQLPGRWTFLFSLFAVQLICTAFVQIKGLNLSRTLGGFAIGFFAIYLAKQGIGEQPESQLRSVYLWLLIISAVLILAVLAAEMLANKKDFPEGSRLAKIPFNTVSILCATALTMVCIVDSSMSYVKTSQLENGGTNVSGGVTYGENAAKQRKYGELWRCGDDDFYRVEANGGYTFNPSMIGGYHGMGYYSSTMHGETFKLLRYMGNRVYADNVSSVYNITSPVQNTLFGVKYYIDYARNLGEVPGVQLVESNEECDIRENTTALSLGYPASDAILSLDLGEQVRAVENQNTLLNTILGEEVNVFEKMTASSFTYDNATLSESPNWNTNYFHTIDGNLPAVFRYTYTAETDGNYYMEHNFRAGTIMARWNGKEQKVDIGSQKFFAFGKLTAGTVISIDVEVSNVHLGCVGLNVYKFNDEKWNAAYQKLSASQMQVEQFKATKIRGTINLPERQLVMTTIPQDGGWKAYCDGKQVAIECAVGDLICINVPTGTHTLEFRYHVPKLGMGITISIFALLASLWMSLPMLRKVVLDKVSVLKKPAEKAAAE